MKLNVVLPWILVLGLGAAAASVYVKSAAKDSQISSLKQQVADLESLQTEVEELRARVAISEDQVLVPKKDKEELIKLRGEMGPLRDRVNQLTREAELAKRNAEMAKSETAKVLQDSQNNAAAIATMRAEAQAQQNQQSINICLNNLRQLDHAKQQWALENNTTAQSVPQPEEITHHLPGNVIPTCPGGGTYTLNDMGHLPTCSVPAHRLQ
jgi:hypothetical protein